MQTRMRSRVGQGVASALLLAIAQHIGVDALGGAPQRQLSECEQIAALESFCAARATCSGT